MILLLWSCVTGTGEEPPLPADSAMFYERVEPVLALRCANPSCHGSAERPLQVYAVHRHRADPAHIWLDAPLTAAEHAANFDRARAWRTPDPDASLLVRKPLDPEVGGASHAGGVQFADREEPDWRALYDWVEADP